MKKIISVLAGLAVLFVLSSCGGGGGSQSQSQSQKANVTLGKLDDYFDVLSYTLETDAKQKDADHLEDIQGTLTLVVRRNKEEMKYKAGQVYYAEITGSTTSTGYYVFRETCTAAAKKLLKIEPGNTESITMNISGIDPCYDSTPEEEKAANRKHHYTVLAENRMLSEIEMEIFWEDNDED